MRVRSRMCFGGRSAGGLVGPILAGPILAGLLILGATGYGMLARAAPASDEIGLRAGGSEGKNGAGFSGYEVFVRTPLRWNGSWNDRWRIETRLEASLGWLEAAGDDGLIASLGPAFVFGRSDSRWRLELGVKPTWLSEDRYGRVDLGGHAHFSSHLGLHYRFRGGLQLGYRFQHTSNADLDTSNPGLDMHLVTLSWIL